MATKAKKRPPRRDAGIVRVLIEAKRALLHSQVVTMTASEFKALEKALRDNPDAAESYIDSSDVDTDYGLEDVWVKIVSD